MGGVKNDLHQFWKGRGGDFDSFELEKHRKNGDYGAGIW